MFLGANLYKNSELQDHQAENNQSVELAILLMG